MNPQIIPITLAVENKVEDIPNVLVGSATILFSGISDAGFLNRHVLAPHYEVMEDGSIKLIELCWIKNGRAPYVKRKGQS